MIKTIKSIWLNKSIKKKIIATLLLILVYKLLSVIPVYGVNADTLSSVMAKNAGLSFFSALMGGGLEKFSIILMGLSPYINASIIIQLLGVIVPRIGELQKEGEQGHRKITKITRWLTLPLAFVQSYGMILLLNNLAGVTLVDTSDTKTILMAMTIITAGTIFLVWLGELMTEVGIGNGISVIITAGVLSGVPGVIMGHISTGDYSTLVGLIIATIVIIFVIIKFTEGNRRIPVIYSRTGREEKSYFPIRINQAGMVPIIFAVSLITFPSLAGQVMVKSLNETINGIGSFLVKYFSMDSNTLTWWFIGLYFLLVVGFSFFYVSITFNTDNVAESIQKRGGYIPGIRPGSETSSYLTKVSAHLNLFGGSFLALIAVLPYVLSKILGHSVDFLISGAGLIIIVSVILDVVRKVDAELKMYDYSKYR